MKLKVETFTPERALDLLERSTNVRKVNQGVVANYARLMKSGLWNVNGETIKLRRSSDGSVTCTDGQHRLWACATAGVEFRSAVVYDAESEDNVDHGLRRSAAQLMRVSGVRNAQDVEATARLIWTERTFGTVLSAIAGGEKMKASIAELRAIVEEHQELEDLVSFALRVRCAAARPSLAAWLLFKTQHTPLAETARWFVIRLGDGSGLKRGDPVYALRERLMRARHSPKEKLLLFVRAWNATARGEQMKKLPMPTHLQPLITTEAEAGA